MKYKFRFYFYTLFSTLFNLSHGTFMVHLLTMRVEIDKEMRKAILHIARTHGIRRVRVFGSQAQGKAIESSDIDLLVDIDSGRDLFDLAGFKLDLEDLLKCHVDVVTEGALSPLIRDHILNEATQL